MRHAHRGSFNGPRHVHARLQVPIDQSQQYGIRAAGFKPRHQPVVIDLIEEGLQVRVHHPAVAGADVRLHFTHGLMRRAPWTKSVTVAVKMRFPLRRYDLRDGLLNETVQHRGNAQGTGLPIWLWNLHTLDRLRLVFARLQLRAYLQPVVAEVLW